MNLEKIQNLTMNSQEIARLSNRRHDNVLRDIRKMFNELNIDETPYKMPQTSLLNFEEASQSQKSYTYNLTKDLTLTLISWYSIKLRKAIIDRWQELENEVNKPKTFEEIMQDALLLADQKVKELENKIALDKPKVEFADAVGNAWDSILIRDYCKILNDNWINIWQNRLYSWLRANWYLMRDNRPYQNFIKYFSVKEKIIQTVSWDRIVLTTYINWAGQAFFHEKLKSDFSN